MRSLALAAVLVGAVLALPQGAARAQSDTRALYDRIDRLERDMNLLQRQVYRGSSGGAPVPMAPADSGTAVNTELRMDQLETQLRALTGTVEEINYSIDQLKRRLDQLVGDVDLRLSQLEKPGEGKAAEASKGSPPPAPPPVGGPPRGQTAAANPPPPPPSGSANVLGTLPVERGQGQPLPPGLPARPGTPPGGAQANANPTALPAGTAQDQYNYAFGLLRQADYPAAEQALRAFVQRYPNDPLAGNAQYWLGETYYVRKDYNNAAAAFADGYRKYPQGGKGADSLLKLGMSLSEAGQKKDACLTFSQLEKEYPKASGNIVERAKGERQRLDCDKQR